GQQVQLTGSNAELSALKLILAFPSDVNHHYRQHLLVNVNCCDSIRHHASPWRSGEHAKGNPRQGHVAIAAPVRETNDAQLFAQSAHAPDQTGARSRLLHCPTDLTAPASAMMPVFHEISRAEGPSQQGRKTKLVGQALPPAKRSGSDQELAGGPRGYPACPTLHLGERQQGKGVAV